MQTLAANQYEVIVSDDGQDYPAEAFCWEHYPWVRYTRGPHRGPAANRNCGARIASGDWLVFTDDDCLPDIGILEAYRIAIFLNPTGKIFEGVILPEGQKPNSRSFAPIKETSGYLWSCNFCILKSTFCSVGKFDEKFKYAHMEDKDFQLRLNYQGFEVFFAPNAKVIHPWRQIADGRTLGKREESLIYYHLKHEIPFSIFAFLFKVIRFYIPQFSLKGQVKNNLVCFFDMFNHFLVVLIHYRNWQKGI